MDQTVADLPSGFSPSHPKKLKNAKKSNLELMPISLNTKIKEGNVKSSEMMLH
jgi:hypothetical protein